MSLSTPGGGGEEQGGLFTEMNVTPLTDIFLVLLIIFMVTASGLTASSLDVALPKAQTPGSVDASSVVVVSIDRKDRLFVGKDEIPDPTAVEGAVRAALAHSKEQSVVLAGDGAVALDKVVLVMEAARKAGAKRFAIAVSREGKTVETSAAAAPARAPGGAIR